MNNLTDQQRAAFDAFLSEHGWSRVPYDGWFADLYSAGIAQGRKETIQRLREVAGDLPAEADLYFRHAADLLESEG